VGGFWGGGGEAVVVRDKAGVEVQGVGGWAKRHWVVC